MPRVQGALPGSWFLLVDLVVVHRRLAVRRDTALAPQSVCGRETRKTWINYAGNATVVSLVGGRACGGLVYGPITVAGLALLVFGAVAAQTIALSSVFLMGREGLEQPC
jgi:hypothetical protein